MTLIASGRENMGPENRIRKIKAETVQDTDVAITGH